MYNISWFKFTNVKRQHQSKLKRVLQNIYIIYYLYTVLFDITFLLNYSIFI